jgi:hypothetical protein
MRLCMNCLAKTGTFLLSELLAVIVGEVASSSSRLDEGLSVRSRVSLPPRIAAKMRGLRQIRSDTEY